MAWLAAAAVACFVASAADAPRLKPGLWEMRMSSSAGGANVALPPAVCVGAMSDAQRQEEEANIRARCGRYEARVVGAQWVVDAVCTARGRTITKHVVTSLNGETFHEENTAPQGSSTSDGRWIGPCKPGQVPETYK